jgi:hypothetical protein
VSAVGFYPIIELTIPVPGQPVIPNPTATRNHTVSISKSPNRIPEILKWNKIYPFPALLIMSTAQTLAASPSITPRKQALKTHQPPSLRVDDTIYHSLFLEYRWKRLE